jgi:hypothetical protein
LLYSHLINIKIQGAKFYYVRSVLHNQPDNEGRKLLMRIKAAMESDSVLRIDELVLPDTGLDSYSATFDLTAMAATASLERSQDLWLTPLDDVGLCLTKTYGCNPASCESVMDVRLK